MRAIHLKALGLIVPAVLWAGALAAAEYTVAQHNETFEKDGAKIDKLTIKAGDTIHIRNMDPWFHNVFSLSELMSFVLGSYPQGQLYPGGGGGAGAGGGGGARRARGRREGRA